MLQGVSVSLIAWGRFHNDWGGQILVIFSLTIAACEAAIALALVLMLYHRNGKLDIDAWHELRESNLPPYTDANCPRSARRRRSGRTCRRPASSRLLNWKKNCIGSMCEMIASSGDSRRTHDRVQGGTPTVEAHNDLKPSSS